MRANEKRLGPANPVAFYLTLALFVLFAGFMVAQKYIGHIEVKSGELVCLDNVILDEGGEFYFKNKKVKRIDSTGHVNHELANTTKNGRWQLTLKIKAMYQITNTFANMCDEETNNEYIQNIIIRDIANGIMNNRDFRRAGYADLDYRDLNSFMHNRRLIVILKGSSAQAKITRVKKPRKGEK